MSIPGWYPDPARQPGRFRYWDGANWSPSTSADPSDPPPGPPTNNRKRGRTAALVVTAVVLVLAVVVVLVVRSRELNSADPGPVTSASSSDATDAPSPVPTTPPSPTGLVPSSPPSSPAPTGTCPEGAPESRQPHPSDGRIHGGGISFPAVAGWSTGALPRRLSWAYDVGGQQTTAANGQPAMVAVGALATFDGFEAPEQAADAVLDCAVGASAAGRRDLTAEPFSLEAYDGWRIRAVLVYGSGATPSIDQVDVIVVDLGSPESLAMFWSSAPADDQRLVDQLDRVATQLETA